MANVVGFIQSTIDKITFKKIQMKTLRIHAIHTGWFVDLVMSFLKPSLFINTNKISTLPLFIYKIPNNYQQRFVFINILQVLITIILLMWSKKRTND